MSDNNKFPIVAKTIFGLEEVLADELRALGASDIKIGKRAVEFTGGERLLYESNLWCRTALRILKPIKAFNAADEKELYDNIKSIEWWEYFDINKTIAVDAVVNNSTFTNSHFIALKSKDAVVDKFRDKYGSRPSVSLENPDIMINIHINQNFCTVSLDSSGESLHKRGYRVNAGSAPVSEVLAAGMVILSGWKKDCNFIDPMCGSGTILIEAALFANNIPPNVFRKSFSFQHWNDYDEKLWQKIVKESLAKQTEFEHKIIGIDKSREAIEMAGDNIRSAKFHKDIELEVNSMEEYEPPKEKGIVITNPPYGRRIMQDDIISFYKTIGDALKKKYINYDAWLITSDAEALKFVGLRSSKRIQIYNGQLECRFVKFEMYEGSRKIKKQK